MTVLGMFCLVCTAYVVVQVVKLSELPANVKCWAVKFYPSLAHHVVENCIHLCRTVSTGVFHRPAGQRMEDSEEIVPHLFYRFELVFDIRQ
jgi:hypothetical protein